MTYYVGIIAFVTFLLGFAAVYAILGRRSLESARLREVLKEAPSGEATTPAPSMFSAVFDIERLVGTVPLRKWLGESRNPQVLSRLTMAGFRRPFHADVFRTLKIGFPIVLAIVGFFLFKENSLFEAAVFAAIGFLLPDIFLSTIIRRRKDRIKAAVPDSLDLLSICVEAGLGLDQAVLRVATELKLSHPDLSDELTLVTLEQRAGKPRLDAWRHMADRSGVEVVRSLTNMLTQADRFGTPISRSLSAFSEELRTRRRQAAEEKAAKTTIKLIPPLVFFIFPSVFVVLLGPAVITISQNLSKTAGGP
jgi:tight adherence protein C